MNQSATGALCIPVVSFLIDVLAPEHFVKISGVHVDIALSGFPFVIP